MSLADACIVRMTEISARHAVLTLDSDFTIYRILSLRSSRHMVIISTLSSTRAPTRDWLTNWETGRGKQTMRSAVPRAEFDNGILAAIN